MTNPAPSGDLSVQLGPKRDRRAASDRKMLRAATHLIGTKGTVGANLAQIGLDAGFSRGLPVQRFGTKLNLLIAVLDAIQDRFLRHVAKRIGRKRGLEAVRERIVLQLEAVHSMPESAVALYQLIVDSTGALPELKPRVTQLQTAYHDNLREYLAQAQTMGELRDGADLDQAVRIISGMISGTSIQALVTGDTARLNREAGEIADIAISQIALP